MDKHYPLYLGNIPYTGQRLIDVTDKFTGQTVTQVAEADPALISKAADLATEAAKPMRDFPAHARRDVLLHVAECVKRDRALLEEIVCIEGGKPRRDSRAEVSRLFDTLRTGAEEATRLNGETLPLDMSARTDGYMGMTMRAPVGPCSFISPFNFPLNLAAHKIAPAIAAGCPFGLKPASYTPVSALMLGRYLAETNLPKGAFSILPCRREGADLLTTDERFKLLSFTGSPAVGWRMKERAGRKKIVLELGGNAAVVVDETAGLEDAAARIANATFGNSGQSCISVQRIYVHSKVYAAFRELLLNFVKPMKSGNPLEEDTIVGPLISDGEAERLETWMEEAVKTGGRVVCGGKRNGRVFEPTLLENVPRTAKVVCEEAFGPVAVLSVFDNFRAVLDEVNDSRYGLQAGIFTKEIARAMAAWRELEVGGVIINDVPSFRVDSMPYGGVKDSGYGREGLRYAIQDMTETRLLVVRPTPP